MDGHRPPVSVLQLEAPRRPHCRSTALSWAIRHREATPGPLGRRLVGGVPGQPAHPSVLPHRTSTSRAKRRRSDDGPLGLLAGRLEPFAVVPLVGGHRSREDPAVLAITGRWPGSPSSRHSPRGARGMAAAAWPPAASPAMVVTPRELDTGHSSSSREGHVVAQPAHQNQGRRRGSRSKPPSGGGETVERPTRRQPTVNVPTIVEARVSRRELRGHGHATEPPPLRPLVPLLSASGRATRTKMRKLTLKATLRLLTWTWKHLGSLSMWKMPMHPSQWRLPKSCGPCFRGTLVCTTTFSPGRQVYSYNLYDSPRSSFARFIMSEMT